MKLNNWGWAVFTLVVLGLIVGVGLGATYVAGVGPFDRSQPDIVTEFESYFDNMDVTNIRAEEDGVYWTWTITSGTKINEKRSSRAIFLKMLIELAGTEADVLHVSVIRKDGSSWVEYFHNDCSYQSFINKRFPICNGGNLDPTVAVARRDLRWLNR